MVDISHSRSGVAGAIEKLSEGVVNARKKTLGFLDEERDKPVIAIGNSFSELNLAHLNFNNVTQRVREGILMTGGAPIECGLLAMCDSMAHGRVQEKYVLPSREIMADAIEAYITAHGVFSGMVCVGTCDKVLPAMAMAAVRVDVPTILVTGGPQPPQLNHAATAHACCEMGKRRHRRGEAFTADVDRLRNEKYVKSLYLDGAIDEEDFVDLYYSTNATPGTCRPYATAGTMNYFLEALGLSLFDSSLVPEGSTERALRAKQAGIAAVRIAETQLRPRQVVTRGAVENALRCVLATGGSMNVILHALAIANTAGLQMDYADVARLADETPFLIDLKNEHALDMSRFRGAGGVFGVMKALGDLIDHDAMTVNGRTVGELLTETERGPAIAPREAPLQPRGGIRVLRGTLAPRGALFNTSNVPPCRLTDTLVRPAAVFESFEQFAASAAAGSIGRNAAIVIRYEGPIGGPGMREAHRVAEVVNHLNVLDADHILITDGRYSGASSGFIIGYLAPEAGEPDSPLSLIQNGDEIRVSLTDNRLDWIVPADEVERRRAQHDGAVPPIPEQFPYLHRYRRLVGPTDRGAILT